MRKISVLKNGISKKTEKVTNSIKEFADTGVFATIRPYNIVEIDLSLSETGAHMKNAMKNIANELVKYYKKNGAKNVKIRNCWNSSQKVYNGSRNEEYYAGWIEIEFEKEIKSLGRMCSSLDKKIEELVRIEIEKMEEVKEMVNIQDVIIEHIEEMEKEFPTEGNIADIVTNAILDYTGDWLTLHKDDRFDYLYDILSGENMMARL